MGLLRIQNETQILKQGYCGSTGKSSRTDLCAESRAAVEQALLQTLTNVRGQRST